MNYYALIIFISFGFAGWPIVGNYSGAGGPWVAIVVSAGTAAVVACVSALQISAHAFPGIRAFTLLALAGILNGVALTLYTKKSVDASISPATFIVSVSIMIAVWAPILNWGLNGSVPSIRQFAGFGFAAMAIYMLAK